MKKYTYYIAGFILMLVAVLFVASTVWASPTMGRLLSLPFQSASCGQTGAWNILVIGSDYAELRGQRGSDLTRVVHVNFDDQKIATFAFSRDLWVDTSGLGLTNPTIDATKLGKVFYEARIRSSQLVEKDTIVDGTRTAGRMISKNFSVKLDHYLAIDLNNLAGMIDSLGGLPIDVPTRTTDPYIKIVIPAGQQTLTGSQVVAYARAIPDSDFDRIQRNNLILEALQKKILEPSTLTKLPDMLSKFKNAIATDLTTEQIDQLVCVLESAPASSIVHEMVRKEWTMPGPMGSFQWNKAKVEARLKELEYIP